MGKGTRAGGLCVFLGLAQAGWAATGFETTKYMLIDGSGSGSIPSINATGAVTYSTYTGVAKYELGGITSVASGGQTAAGTGGATFAYGTFNEYPNIDAQGRVTFLARLNQGLTGVTASNDIGIWATDLSGNAQLLMREGSQVPGLPAGVLFGESGLTSNYLFNNGRAGFRNTLSGAGVTADNDEALIRASASAVNVVAREGDQAPGMAAGVHYGESFGASFISSAINSSGQMAFLSFVTGPGIDGSKNNGLFAPGAGGALTLIAQKGGSAGSTQAGAVWNNYGIPHIDANGRVMFGGNYAIGPGGVTTSNESALFATNGNGTLYRMYRENEQVPGMPAGDRFDQFGAQAINTLHTAFIAIMKQGSGDVVAGNDYIVIEDGQVVARSGQAVPGLPVGITPASYTRINLNVPGAILMETILTGPGVTTANDDAWLSYVPGDGLKMIVREGDVIEVSPGVNKTISSVQIFNNSWTGNEDGVNSGLSDAGTVTFRASFVEGGSAVMLTIVPEPVGLAGLAMGAAIGLRRRRK